MPREDALARKLVDQQGTIEDEAAREIHATFERMLLRRSAKAELVSRLTHV